MRQLKFTNNKWEITPGDVGSVMLLKGGEERKVNRDDIGMFYVVDPKNGDYLEEPPYDEDDDSEDTDD